MPTAPMKKLGEASPSEASGGSHGLSPGGLARTAASPNSKPTAKLSRKATPASVRLAPAAAATTVCTGSALPPTRGICPQSPVSTWPR